MDLIWKVKMIIFLQSSGCRVSKAITKLFLVPNGSEDTWIDITIKKFEANEMSYCKNSMMMIFLEDKLQVYLWDLE